MLIDTEKVKRRAKPNLFSRPISPIRMGRQLPPSKMRKRAEFFKLIFGVLILIILTTGLGFFAWTLVSEGANYAEIRAEQEVQKNQISPVSMPITFKPSQK